MKSKPVQGVRLRLEVMGSHVYTYTRDIGCSECHQHEDATAERKIYSNRIIIATLRAGGSERPPTEGRTYLRPTKKLSFTSLGFIRPFLDISRSSRICG
jgi:hypothetical protein